MIDSPDLTAMDDGAGDDGPTVKWLLTIFACLVVILSTLYFSVRAAERAHANKPLAIEAQ